MPSKKELTHMHLRLVGHSVTGNIILDFLCPLCLRPLQLCVKSAVGKVKLNATTQNGLLRSRADTPSSIKWECGNSSLRYCLQRGFILPKKKGFVSENV